MFIYYVEVVLITFIDMSIRKFFFNKFAIALAFFLH